MPRRRRPSSLLSGLAHARYVVSDNPVTGLSFGLFILLLVLALIGPVLAPFDPLASDTVAALKPPSPTHWFGTDQLGRDILSRVIVATRLDMVIAISSVALVFVFGGLAGIASGFYGGWTDRIIGRLSDTIMAFPLFVLAMGIVAALGNTVTNIVIATAIINFPLYVRIARARSKHSAQRRLRAGGAPDGQQRRSRIVLTQILPNILPLMMVQMSFTMGYAILNAAGLSFIGLGVRPPTPEWGIMVAEGAGFIVSGEYWIALFPRCRFDGRRLLLQPARRRICATSSIRNVARRGAI